MGSYTLPALVRRWDGDNGNQRDYDACTPKRQKIYIDSNCCLAKKKRLNESVGISHSNDSSHRTPVFYCWTMESESTYKALRSTEFPPPVGALPVEFAFFHVLHHSCWRSGGVASSPYQRISTKFSTCHQSRKMLWKYESWGFSPGSQKFFASWDVNTVYSGRLFWRNLLPPSSR
jgi:hypothetical protein